MAMTFSELEREFEKSKLKYRPMIDKNRIITGMATDHYEDPDGDKGVVIQVRLSEPARNDERPISEDVLRELQQELSSASSKDISAADLRELFNQKLNSNDIDQRFEIIEFYVAPLKITREQKPPRSTLIEIANKVNSKIKFSSFFIDDDDDVMFLHQMSLDAPDQKFLAGGIRRMCGAMSQACDEFITLVNEYLKNNSKPHASSHKESSDSSEEQTDTGSNALIKRGLKIYFAQNEEKVSEDYVEHLFNVIRHMVQNDMLKHEMTDEMIFAIINHTLKKLSEEQDDSDEQSDLTTER